MVSSKQEFIRGIHNLRPEHRGNVVTIGSFDGVHRGHQAILAQVRAKAAEMALPSTAMIFEPQPHEFFSGLRAPARLMRLKEKVEALFQQGVDRVCCLPFTKAFSQLTAEAFIQQVLVEGLDTQYLVVGDDFRFGSERSGDFALLASAGQAQGFTVSDTQSFLVNDERVSSTKIRELLEQNEFDQAALLLGRPYTISGRVVRGQQMGRKLGAPTANVHLHRFRSPLSGVFAVEALLHTGIRVKGVANVGVRPTLGGDDKPILEVHLFDRDDELYGQTIVVEFKYKLRDEQRFDSLEDLRQHIQRDIQRARAHFAT